MCSVNWSINCSWMPNYTMWVNVLVQSQSNPFRLIRTGGFPFPANCDLVLWMIKASGLVTPWLLFPIHEKSGLEGWRNDLVSPRQGVSGSSNRPAVRLNFLFRSGTIYDWIGGHFSHEINLSLRKPAVNARSRSNPGFLKKWVAGLLQSHKNMRLSYIILSDCPNNFVLLDGDKSANVPAQHHTR